VYRGRFVANGKESELKLWTQGGSAFGSSVWINSSFIGSWTGDNAYRDNNSTYALPKLTAAKEYVFTILVDNNGLDGNWVVGADVQKNPRGVSYYCGHKAVAKPDRSWITSSPATLRAM
jgi:beta-galactosidase